MIARADAEALDAGDPLAPFRDRFVHGDPERIYLDGNSLGMPPVLVGEALAAHTADWADRLVDGWEDWIDEPLRAGDALAPLLGVDAGEVLVCDSVTVNLFKLAHAALDLRPGAIVTDRGNFPTDRYVLAGVARQRDRELREIACDEIAGPRPDDVASALAAGDVGLVVLSHVAYRSGAMADLPAITALVHEAGAEVIWDLSHAAGAVEPALAQAGARLAVGCTYKYLNAGPGAPAFLVVAADLAPTLRTPIQGWFGQHEQFAMERPYEPAGGIARFLAGTPPIGGLVAVKAAATLCAEAGIARIRAKGVALTELAIALHDEQLAALGFELGTPRDPAARGAHVALRHPEAWPICRAMIEQAKVVPDFRGPDSIRLGLSPLTTRFVDVHDAAARIRDLVASGAHRAVRPGGRRVT